MVASERWRLYYGMLSGISECCSVVGKAEWYSSECWSVVGNAEW